jgi:hypothetical protein
MAALLPGLLNRVYVQMTDKLNEEIRATLNEEIRATLAESDGGQTERLIEALDGFEGWCESWVIKANMITDGSHYPNEKIEKQAADALAGELEGIARRIVNALYP